jgi:hypothetical protein
MGSFESVRKTYSLKYGVLADLLPSVIAVKFRLKTAVEFTFAGEQEFSKQRPVIREFCADAKLNMTHFPLDDQIKLHISRKPLAPVTEKEDQHKDNRFSYPACCIKRYKAETKVVSFPFINGLAELLQNAGRFDFRMNPFLRVSAFHLYEHLPCSLECKETLEYCRRLLSVIHAKNLDLYTHIVRFNTAPVLFTDICGVGILFSGDLQDGTVMYESFYYCYPPRNHIHKSAHNTSADVVLFERIVQALAAGNQVLLDSAGLTVQTDAHPVATFDRPVHLRWKLVEFVDSGQGRPVNSG